ncbi:ATP-binding protein [Kibdelosporangium phytohabitans]|uniref:LuxR family transcriptional regulator n=1 Tax=Kibdelosporangium phytohabitans TaxID=860235 RepID=A0A0N9I7P9_9PSEU|nr:helix-turn-helix transcriptional regulator [Kibdelosporangium phytohabitans]ALG11851.1 LuxR family transcriptional regulator [Kibdelosporangium phytohabitans]MBE1463280.1 DNA-binding CsgD family transcriptional regulator [Kibdelosporangium phytohabitans]
MLIGRNDEIRRIEDLIGAARQAHGGALVVRGEPGIGKSALLDRVRQSAADFAVIEASGSQFESELPFAVLHQVLGHQDELPEPLRIAFGMATGTPEMFAIGLAALDVLGRLAQRQPVLCLIDDGQWLDDSSAKVLTFLARRIASEPIAMVFAARDGQDEPPSLDGLPGVTLGALPDADARALLRASMLDEQVRDRIVAEARGNPLALLELPKAGGFAMPDASSTASRIERSFQARLAGLPGDVRLLLTLASADPTGDPGLVWAAARQLGIDPSAGGAAEASELVEFGTRVRFCHPLARSAVYRAAEAGQRHIAHGALADATDALTDPDRRAWHRAQSGTGPDESVASELERSADRARSRGGVAAAAAFLERAAALSADSGKRLDRTFAAVEAKLDAGGAETAVNLLSTVELNPLDTRGQAKADLLRGKIAFTRHTDDSGPEFMMRAAKRLADVDPVWSRECFLDAVEMAMFVGRSSGILDTVLETARDTVRSEPGTVDLLDALTALASEGHKTAVPLLRQVFADERAVWTRRPALATMIAGELWDYDMHAAVVGWLMKTGRTSGSPMVLRLGLAQTAVSATLRGELPRAIDAIAEEEAIADAMGVPPMVYARIHLVAMRGRRKEAAELFGATSAVATALGIGQLAANVDWATAVVHNGLAEYPTAMEAARKATAAGDLYVAGISQPELIEAAVRCGENDIAAAELESLTERTQASGSPRGLGVASYARALVTGDEDDYRAAIDYLGTGTAAPALARAHLLYGEWLRRQNRRTDAREHLRAAHEQLSAIGMEAFASRAADELRATGEQARSRTSPTYDQLTMQEQHIARLVATGATSKEVAARLFLSPRTIDAHLRNIFRKLGISSRRQLRDLPDIS